jgi:hypothetical protein
MRLLSPYFDDEGKLVRDLASRLRARQFDVITDLNRCNLTRTATESIRAAGGRFLAMAEDSPLHAKAIHAAGPGWEIGASGSANLTNAAWRGHNAELLVFRHGAQASRIGHLIDERQVREIEDNEWLDVWARAEEERRARKAKLHGEGPSGSSACWLDRQHLQVTVNGPVPQTIGAQWMSGATAGVPQVAHVERVGGSLNGPQCPVGALGVGSAVARVHIPFHVVAILGIAKLLHHSLRTSLYHGLIEGLARPKSA